MSSGLRLQWLATEIHNGRHTFVTFSYNYLTQTEKIKFVSADKFDCYDILQDAACQEVENISE